MTMLRFTAEGSLYKANGHYHMACTPDVRTGQYEVSPQQGVFERTIGFPGQTTLEACQHVCALGLQWGSAAWQNCVNRCAGVPSPRSYGASMIGTPGREV
jgi:hypothetical protein